MSRSLNTHRDDGADPRTLGHIASRLSEIAAECVALSLDSDTSVSPPLSASSLNPLPKLRARDLAQRVHSYLLARRARSNILGGDWFADPAWDLLLDLLASQYLGRPVSISSACIAANVPPTTALRWIDKLVQEGLLVRESDPADRRRAHLSIAPELAARLEEWIEHHLPPSICSNPVSAP